MQVDRSCFVSPLFPAGTNLSCLKFQKNFWGADDRFMSCPSLV